MDHAEQHIRDIHTSSPVIRKRNSPYIDHDSRQENDHLPDRGIENETGTLGSQERHTKVQDDRPHPSPLPGGHPGAYRRASHISTESRIASGQASRVSIPQPSQPGSPSTLVRPRLDMVLQDGEADLDTYGIEEFRDGFFDASFFPQRKRDGDVMREKAYSSLPTSFQNNQRKPVMGQVLEQLEAAIGVLTRICTTRASIKFLKSFMAVYIAFIICLIPTCREWLGRYNYMLVVSAILNHPGRPVGSQIEGALMTSLGMACGLAWGCLAVYVSEATGPARAGSGGLIALFLVLFTIILGWLRCIFIRFYQAVISAGVALYYVCLANTKQGLSMRKISDFAIPWLLGQVICLVVCFTLFPSAGSRPLAVSFHFAFESILAQFEPESDDSNALKHRLSWHFVDLSTAVRDFALDFSFSRYRPADSKEVRNLIQGIVRAALAMRSDPLRNPPFLMDESSPPSIGPGSNSAHLVRESLGKPAHELRIAMREGVRRADAVLMDMSGHRKYIGPDPDVSSNLEQIMEDLTVAIKTFDTADQAITEHPDLPLRYSNDPDLVEIFLFVNPLRLAAGKVLDLLECVNDIKGKGYRLNKPSYPLGRAFLRSNAQVRHDRGGLTAAVYFGTKTQLQETMKQLEKGELIPHDQEHEIDEHVKAETTRSIQTSVSHDPPKKTDENESIKTKGGQKIAVHKAKTVRLKMWQALHRLQGFESRFAFKITLVTGLAAIPSYLPQSKDWWFVNESWWVVVTIWIAMHPRVGGTAHDLLVRITCAALGALFGGLAYGVGKGNPYINAAFAALFLIPMLYRFTQSSHPRSGLIACLSFTVVSLSAYTNSGDYPIVHVAWTRALAFIVGITAAVTVNALLWPFVARHELRKSLSAMLLHSAILYRSVVARYIYYSDGQAPGPEVVARSEMLEGRLREGFVRIRQLMDLTQHEIRLRAPFDPLPYSALIQSLEAFFESLVQVRQSSLYFRPHMLAGDANSGGEEELLTLRRDAVAAILMTLYVLAGALRSDRPLPRFLPSAAAARQRLLDGMEKVEAAQAIRRDGLLARQGEGRRWADIYHEAYSAALTDIVEELGVLEYYTKEIVGEVGFNGMLTR
ncbi:hypothetical protein MMC25_001776 [Agyrium rufum]|nr:hypothetical protein [Agyrium rufum]